MYQSAINSAASHARLGAMLAALFFTQVGWSLEPPPMPTPSYSQLKAFALMCEDLSGESVSASLRLSADIVPNYYVANEEMANDEAANQAIISHLAVSLEIIEAAEPLLDANVSLALAPATDSAVAADDTVQLRLDPIGASPSTALFGTYVDVWQNYGRDQLPALYVAQRDPTDDHEAFLFDLATLTINDEPLSCDANTLTLAVKTDSPTSPQPTLTLDEAAGGFGSVTVTNLDQVPHLVSMSVTPLSENAAIIATDTCSQQWLAPQQTCTLSLAPTPNQTGDYRANISAKAETGGWFTSSWPTYLAPTASTAFYNSYYANQPFLTYDMLDLETLNIFPDQPSASQTFTLSNLGPEALLIKSLVWESDSPALELDSDCEASSGLGENETCSLTVTYTQLTQEAQLPHATLQIISNDGRAPVRSHRFQVVTTPITEAVDYPAARYRGVLDQFDAAGGVTLVTPARVPQLTLSDPVLLPIPDYSSGVSEAPLASLFSPIIIQLEAQNALGILPLELQIRLTQPEIWRDGTMHRYSCCGFLGDLSLKGQAPLRLNVNAANINLFGLRLPLVRSECHADVTFASFWETLGYYRYTWVESLQQLNFRETLSGLRWSGCNGLSDWLASKFGDSIDINLSLKRR